MARKNRFQYPRRCHGLEENIRLVRQANTGAAGKQGEENGYYILADRGFQAGRLDGTRSKLAEWW